MKRKQNLLGDLPPWVSEISTYLRQTRRLLYWEFLRDEGVPDYNWVKAFDQYDLGNEEPLQRLLGSDCELPPKVEEYLVDLIERRIASKGRGRPRTPAYRASEINALYLLARLAVRSYVRRGMMSVDEAITKVASDNDLNRTTLANCYNDKHDPLRKAMKKR